MVHDNNWLLFNGYIKLQKYKLKKLYLLSIINL